MCRSSVEADGSNVVSTAVCRDCWILQRCSGAGDDPVHMQNDDELKS